MSDKQIEIWDMAFKSEKPARDTIWEVYQHGRVDGINDLIEYQKMGIDKGLRLALAQAEKNGESELNKQSIREMYQSFLEFIDNSNLGFKMYAYMEEVNEQTEEEGSGDLHD